MNSLLLSYIERRRLNLSYIEKKCISFDDTISVPVYRIDWQNGWQDRYAEPEKHNWVKSKTRFGSRWIYFFNWWDKDKDILIVEWEIDFLSIIPYATNYNLMWLKGVNNLGTAIKEIEKLRKVYDVYILIDNDKAADMAIQKLEYTDLHLYDVRQALSWYKDVNDAICNDALNMDFVPKRIIKLKPQREIKQVSRGWWYDTMDKINALPVNEVLERLYPQYSVGRDGSIRDMDKKTNGYKYRKERNLIVDFSWKDRPHWNPYMIAKQKFGDAKTTFQYFKNLY